MYLACLQILDRDMLDMLDVKRSVCENLVRGDRQ